MSKFNNQVNKLILEARVKRHGDLFVREVGAGLKKYYKDPECLILHREDGPAAEYVGCSDRFKELNDKYFLDGKQYKKSEWLIYRKLRGGETAPDKKTIDTMVSILDI